MKLTDWLAGVLFGLAGVPPAPAPPPKPPSVQPPPPTGVPADLIAAHNRVRAAAGLKPLMPNARLQSAAQSHANFMAAKGVMAHYGIGDGTHVERFAQAGYASTASAENVAEGQATTDQVVKDWMGSPGHRANILGDYREFGGAVAYGPSRPGSIAQIYWCTVFATPLGALR